MKVGMTSAPPKVDVSNSSTSWPRSDSMEAASRAASTTAGCGVSAVTGCVTRAILSRPGSAPSSSTYGRSGGGAT
jgi:hypothetical protein